MTLEEEVQQLALSWATFSWENYNALPESSQAGRVARLEAFAREVQRITVEACARAVEQMDDVPALKAGMRTTRAYWAARDAKALAAKTVRALPQAAGEARK